MDSATKPRSLWREELAGIMHSVLVLLAVVLLFQGFETGNRGVDLLVLAVGLRLVAVAILVFLLWNILRTIRPDQRKPYLVECAGFALWIFGVYIGTAFLLHLLHARMGFFGLDMGSTPTALLVGAVLVVGIVVGILMILYARKRFIPEQLKTFISPDGCHRVAVWRRNRGIDRDRTDLCRTWVVRDRGFLGKQLLAEGYLSWDRIRRGDMRIPLRWLDDSTFVITFDEDPVSDTPGGDRTVRLG